MKRSKGNIMNYFQILGIVFGIIAFLKPFYMHVIPWDENKFIEKTYAEKRPQWIVAVAIFGLFLVGLTWYIELTTQIRYSIIITLMFSLTAVKAILFIFDYKKFYGWIGALLKKNQGKKIILIDIFAGLFGLVMIILSILFLSS